MCARNPQRPVAARTIDRGEQVEESSGPDQRRQGGCELAVRSDPADAPGDAAERQARAGQAAQVFDRTDADAARRAPQEVVLALLPGEPLRVTGDGVLAGVGELQPSREGRG